MIPDHHRRDATWPDLVESNKTPTKASVQKARAATANPLGLHSQSRASFHDPFEEEAIIRKEALAKLSASRSGSVCSEVSTPGGWRPGMPFLPTSNRQACARSTSSASSFEHASIETLPFEATQDDSPLHRTSSNVSTSVKLETPSLASMRSFGDGVWGNDDLPMLKARLHSAGSSTHGNLSSPDDRYRPTNSPAFDPSDELPFTPLVDKLYLFGSPDVDISTPASDILLTPHHIRDDIVAKKHDTVDIVEEKEDWKAAARDDITRAICDELKRELGAIEESSQAKSDSQREARHSDETRPVKSLLHKLLRRFQGNDDESVSTP